MLEMLLDKHIFYVLMGFFAVLGVVSKLVANASLKRLVKAAGNMGKSSHSLMRLVRAKFEHACMVSDRVENVRVFVDKYIYEYKVLGIKLYSLRRMERVAAAICLMFGVLGAIAEYQVQGMQEQVLRIGVTGGILAVLLYLFQMTTDEAMQMEMVRNYMVDYLENVCLHKYEKVHQREATVEEEFEESEKIPLEEEEEIPIPEKEQPEMEPPVPTIPEVLNPEPPKPQTVKQQSIKTVQSGVQTREIPKEEKQEKDALIRQILEEFMA